MSTSISSSSSSSTARGAETPSKVGDELESLDLGLASSNRRLLKDCEDEQNKFENQNHENQRTKTKN
jgi:hypothetical protein